MAFNKVERRARRKKRIRKKISGSLERPRISVFKSGSHIYAQIIDDIKGATLVAASSLEKGLRGEGKDKFDVEKKVGIALAERAAEKGIKKVIFDRNGFAFHGRVKALADAAREKGLVF